MEFYYWIKNNLKPVELPKYKWTEIQLKDSLGYEWAKSKFYATKNWVEFYVWMLGNNDNVDREERRLIIPKWKVVFYRNGLMGILSSKKDYKRYKEWRKK